MDLQRPKQLTLAEIAKIDDGRISEAFAQAVERAARDCDDRPGDDRPRKITMEIAFVPVMLQDGICDTVKSQIQIKETVPTRKSKVMDFGLRKGGMLVYQPMSLDDHRQSTFPVDDDDE